jgi:hypothetical protein
MTLVRLSLAVLGCLLAFPAVAPARVIEIGRANDAEELPAPSCPRSPCFAVSRTTGYQAKVGTNRGLLRVPADGRIVAWTIRLSKPGPRQVQFFNQRLGGPPSAGISVLRPGKRLFGRVVAQSPVQMLEPFLGQTVQFPLNETILYQRVRLSYSATLITNPEPNREGQGNGEQEDGTDPTPGR